MRLAIPFAIAVLAVATNSQATTAPALSVTNAVNLTLSSSVQLNASNVELSGRLVGSAPGAAEVTHALVKSLNAKIQAAKKLVQSAAESLETHHNTQLHFLEPNSSARVFSSPVGFSGIGLTGAGADSTSFSVGDSNYLVFCDHGKELCHLSVSLVGGAQQPIASFAAAYGRPKAFTVSSGTSLIVYIVVAQDVEGSTSASHATQTHRFVPTTGTFSTLATSPASSFSASSVSIMTIGSTVYAVCTRRKSADGSSRASTSTIAAFNEASRAWTQVSTFSTNGASDSAVYTSGSNTYVVVAQSALGNGGGIANVAVGRRSAVAQSAAVYSVSSSNGAVTKLPTVGVDIPAGHKIAVSQLTTTTAGILFVTDTNKAQAFLAQGDAWVTVPTSPTLDAASVVRTAYPVQLGINAPSRYVAVSSSTTLYLSEWDTLTGELTIHTAAPLSGVHSQASTTVPALVGSFAGIDSLFRATTFLMVGRTLYGADIVSLVPF